MNWWVLRRKVHPSWSIAIGSLGLFVGVVASGYLYCADMSSIGVVLISIVIIGVVFWRRYVYLMPLLMAATALFGLWRGSVSRAELGAFQPLYGKPVIIQGTVTDDVDESSDRAVIKLGSLVVNGAKMTGNLWVTSNGDGVKRGDTVYAQGTIKRGFGSFAGVVRDAEIRQVMHPNPGDVARQTRDWFAGIVRTAIPEPESSLGLGFLVGQKGSLSMELVLTLQMAGLTHVVVASGYNLTILVRLARRLFVKVSKYLAALSSVIMIIAFMAVTGLSPSMTRAGLVAGLSLAAWYYGRRFHPLVLLPLAVAVTLVVNPAYAWGDLGWELSFAAFAGVMIMAPLASRYLFGDKRPGFAGQILIETICAQIVTAPILVAAFGQLSNVAVVANLLVLPLVPVAMLLTFAAGIGALIMPGLAWVAGLPATWLIGYMIYAAKYLADLPWAVSAVTLEWWGVVVCYAMIIAGCLYMWRATGYDLRDASLVE